MKKRPFGLGSRAALNCHSQAERPFALFFGSLGYPPGACSGWPPLKRTLHDSHWPSVTIATAQTSHFDDAFAAATSVAYALDAAS
jgi:hypothetical protein